MSSAQDLLEAAAPHLARLDALDARTQEGAMQTLLDMAIAHAGPSATSPKAGTSKGGAKETIDAKLLRECVDLAASLRRLDETAPSEPSDALADAAKTSAALESGMKAFEAHCTTSAGCKALAASGALEAAIQLLNSVTMAEDVIRLCDMLERCAVEDKARDMLCGQKTTAHAAALIAAFPEEENVQAEVSHTPILPICHTPLFPYLIGCIFSERQSSLTLTHSPPCECADARSLAARDCGTQARRRGARPEPRQRQGARWGTVG